MSERKRKTRLGLRALRAAIRIRGMDAINKKTAGAKALFAWRRQLIADLGGEKELSLQKRTLVDVAVRAKLFVDHVDAWLMEQTLLIDTKNKSLFPALRDRTRLVDSLVKTLLELGLERQRAQSMTLEQITQEYARKEIQATSVEPAELTVNEEVFKRL